MRHARRGRAARCVLWSVATQKVTNGSKQLTTAQTQNIALRTRDRTQGKPAVQCSLSKRIFFCSLFFLPLSLYLWYSQKVQNQMMSASSCWVHLPGTPRDTPRSRLLPRPAFSAASCPPARRPPKSLPRFTVAGAGLQWHVGVWTLGCSKTTRLPLSISLPATVTNSATESIERASLISPLLLLACCFAHAHGSIRNLKPKCKPQIGYRVVPTSLSKPTTKIWDRNFF